MKQKVGQQVKLFRLQKGLTQAELGEAIDKAFETISNIERGKTAPSFGTLSDIADALGVSMKDFFDDDGEVLSGRRQELIFKLNAMVGSLDDAKLELLLKLGSVLNEDE